MKMCRKFPISLSEYIQKHAAKYGTVNAEARYSKAKFVYSCLKYPYDYPPYLREWYDEDFGKLTNPEDAFEIWWDC